MLVWISEAGIPMQKTILKMTNEFEKMSVYVRKVGFHCKVIKDQEQDRMLSCLIFHKKHSVKANFFFFFNKNQTNNQK